MQSAKPYVKLQAKLRHKSVRRQMVRTSLLLSNVAILAIIAIFVFHNPHSDGMAQPVANNSAASPAVANPLDQLSSADIALTVARMGGLQEVTAVTNQAQTQAADIAIATSTDNVVSKPQVVATTLKSSADIKDYTALAGDTVSSVAAKFGVTSDSVRWSNSLNTDAVAAGTKLMIPPVNGIVYTVKDGDTADSLAAKFKASKDKIVAYNDGEIKGLSIGQRIIIPGATQVVVVAPAATTAAAIAGPMSTSFPWGSGPIYGSNGYDYGYCTWYVATQIPVPANWGNASTWAYYARQSGWNVSSTPSVGAIAQRGGGEGHVAIVTGVNDDGSVVVSDMNGFAGWGRVGTGTQPAGKYQFITH